MENLYDATRKYFDRMLQSSKGMKIAIFDEETIGIAGVVYARSELLKREVFAHRMLSSRTMPSSSMVYASPRDGVRDGSSENMGYLNAIVFVRPTPKNVRLLEEELERPEYATYTLFFTNSVPESFIDALARADVHERVVGVHEFYADYYTLGPQLFVTQCASESERLPPGYPPLDVFDIDFRQRAVSGLLALLLSLKICPAVRYSEKSRAAKGFARIVSSRMREESAKDGLFKFRSTTQRRRPVLLIVDRADDPVTPLVMQWTYEAMLHECLGIRLNRIKMRTSSSDTTDGGSGSGSSSKASSDESGEFVIDPRADDFYATHAHASFGVVADALQKRTEAYRSRHRDMRDVKEARDIQHLQDRLDQMPELNTLGRNISKHLSILSELNQIVDRRKLFEFTKIEHVLATVHGMSSESESVSSLMRIFESDYDRVSKLKLLLMFAIRYEHSPNKIRRLQRAFDRAVEAVGEEETSACASSQPLAGSETVGTILEHMGVEKRSGDLFKNKTVSAVIGGTFKMFRNLSAGTISQAAPLLRSTVDSLLRGTLSEIEYPYVQGDSVPQGKLPRDVVVFVVGGGCTYAEAREVSAMNDGKSGEGTRVFLGGTHVTNAAGFVEYIRRLRRHGGA